METKYDPKKTAEAKEALRRESKRLDEYYKTPEGKKRKAEVEAALKPILDFIDSLPVDE